MKRVSQTIKQHGETGALLFGFRESPLEEMTFQHRTEGGRGSSSSVQAVGTAKVLRQEVTGGRRRVVATTRSRKVCVAEA